MDEHEHIPTELYLQISRRKRTPDHLTQAVVAAARRLFPALEPHLDRAEAIRERRRRRREEAVAAAGLAALSPALARRLEAERPAAARDLAELAALRPAQRSAALAAAPERFRSPALAEGLVEESRKVVRLTPREAESLATVAGKVALRVPAQVWGGALPARLALRAAAHRANALRVAGELPQADRIWTAIHARRRGGPVLGRVMEAELLSLEASLRQDQRRLDEAERLVEGAVAAYRELGDELGLGKALLQMGNLLDQRGDPADALGTYHEATSMLARGGHHRHVLMGVVNLGLCSCSLGDFAGANQVVETHRSLFADLADPWLSRFLTWLEGRIARGLGDPRAAEKYFREARAAYLAEGNGLNAGLVALDLAELYVETNRPAEAKRLAGAMHGEFAARDVHPEAARALRIFQEAARDERLDPGLIGRLRAYLEAARHDPTLAFQPAA